MFKSSQQQLRNKQTQAQNPSETLMGQLFRDEDLLERTKLQGEYKQINASLLECYHFSSSPPSDTSNNDEKHYFQTARDFHLALYLGLENLKKFYMNTKNASYWKEVASIPLHDYSFPLRRVLKDDARKTLWEMKIHLQRKDQQQSMQELGYCGEHVNKVKRELHINKENNHGKGSFSK